MANSNALLKFPVPPEPENRRTELLFNFRQKPTLLKFSREEAARLLGTAQKVESGLWALLDFVDSHRDDASLAGIETITVELVSERVPLGYIQDALEEAVAKDEGVDLTDESVALLRRMEKLLAEANSNVARFSPSTMSGPSPSYSSSPPASMPSSNDLILPAAIFFGIVALGLIVVVLTPRD